MLDLYRCATPCLSQDQFKGLGAAGGCAKELCQMRATPPASSMLELYQCASLSQV